MIYTNKIYHVDAFTKKPFKGNPAGVMIIDHSVTETWMQNMAAEMNLSETAFLLPSDTGFNIRYFTPTHEVPLCGHATLASAHIVYELGLTSKSKPILFKAKEANLSVERNNDALVMDFPKYPLTKIATPFQFKNMIGFEPLEVYASSYDWIIAVANDENEILSALPDFDLIKKSRLGHLMITAKSDEDEIDFVVRCFAPSLGIDEDPVTGSAHCALTPLWAEKLDKKDMHSLQLSKRTGRLQVGLRDNRVQIMGHAVTIFEASLKI
ncbi:PhzF family phenazine biosynthesis isomerase [Ascidiimonas sp. W6]|uniref:PhzF family phenazine biosynthesis protein n=1 Tax=Ascidiimonas meishanensis TaxID=3128903 RepID=UPI0030EF03F7